MAETGEPFSCLNAVELFADLTAEDLAELDRVSPPRLFHGGELVFSQSQPVSALFILKAGRIRIFRVAEDGRTLTIAILEPGAVFGEMLLMGMQMYDNYAEALEESTVCQLSAADVEDHFLSNPKLAVKISRLLGEQVARLEERLTDMALRPLSARTAATLLKLAEAAPRSRFTHSTSIKLTHEQLAGLLGATREATSKTMSDFATRNLIKQGRGRIIIENVDGLRGISRATF
ncbi:Crp/Fnr family transcriptional regulator [Arthrobacter sp. H20]|uniref:Crp/Fnr family transcriptional regulator n=1 Tax=Arthrobacter sp. H20 TaxID=1267981 RepID=UPI0004B745B3|nr:Crp/Fnr family transcriptional regulator [Arthrobacter sp. H20]